MRVLKPSHFRFRLFEHGVRFNFYFRKYDFNLSTDDNTSVYRLPINSSAIISTPLARPQAYTTATHPLLYTTYHNLHHIALVTFQKCHREQSQIWHSFTQAKNTSRGTVKSDARLGSTAGQKHNSWSMRNAHYNMLRKEAQELAKIARSILPSCACGIKFV